MFKHLNSMLDRLEKTWSLESVTRWNCSRSFDVQFEGGHYTWFVTWSSFALRQLEGRLAGCSARSTVCWSSVAPVKRVELPLFGKAEHCLIIAVVNDWKKWRCQRVFHPPPFASMWDVSSPSSLCDVLISFADSSSYLPPSLPLILQYKSFDSLLISQHHSVADGPAENIFIKDVELYNHTRITDSEK